MSPPEQHPLARAVASGECPAHSTFAALDRTERAMAEAELLRSGTGRRWLRDDPDLTHEQADRLLEFTSDFQSPRRDRTLAAVIERASLAAVERHVEAIAAGPAAPALWKRLAADPSRLVTIASRVVSWLDEQVAEATLYLLVLDPLDPFGVRIDNRIAIATEALSSSSPRVRGLAAEHLASHAPAIIQRSLEELLADRSERVRGIGWDAALRVDRAATVERATALLNDESVPVPIRRSALLSLGTHLPTAQMAELLSYFVVHPDHDLASDAADLLFRQHRNPIAARAAQDSPHADVREIAERLLDPLRGSPAAGGSRPGDPIRSSTDIYADMLRQLDEKAEDQSGQSRG